ncbi:MAG: hypothetical protein ACOC3Y_00220 [Desulfohalobiaceae bacterium]
MQIHLNLQKRCIASEIKRQYELSLQQVLRARQPSRKQELKTEALRQIQERADLVGLRGKHPELQPGSRHEVLLKVDEESGRCRLYLEHEPVLEVRLELP